MDVWSGEVRTARRLDREQRSVHVFTVVASNDVSYDVTAAAAAAAASSRRRDDRRRREVDAADVTVYVDDVNDNAPTFVFPGRERGDVAYLSTGLASRVTGLICCVRA